MSKQPANPKIAAHLLVDFDFFVQFFAECAVVPVANLSPFLGGFSYVRV